MPSQKLVADVDVVLLHRFAAIVEFFVFIPVFGGEFPACKGVTKKRKQLTVAAVFCQFLESIRYSFSSGGRDVFRVPAKLLRDFLVEKKQVGLK